MAGMRRLTVLSAVATAVALALAVPTAAAAPVPSQPVAPIQPVAPVQPAAQPPANTVPGQPAGTAPAAPGGPAVQAGTATPDLFGVYQAAVQGMRSFGIEPFLYPTAAPFCLDGNSLGLAPAVAGAVPGPWPKTTIAIPGLDLTAVKAGQTMFTFVPYGLGRDNADTSGMRVAWLNVTSGRGGLVSMGPLSDVFRAMVPVEVPPALRPMAEQAVQDFFFSALPVGGVRAVPVTTGSGTVLAAVFGTVENGTKSCFFLPTVGITEVP